jgi:predicted cation transporter
MRIRRMMTDLALFRISFGIAAFIFEAMLLILILILGHRQRDNNMKFRTMVILTLCGTVVSVLDNIFRVSKAYVTPLAFQLFLQLVAIVMNVLLTYYVLLYMETFVKNSRKKNWIGNVNVAIVAVCVFCAAGLFLSALPQIHAGAQTVDIPGVFRILIGYGVELYFLL